MRNLLAIILLVMVLLQSPLYAEWTRGAMDWEAVPRVVYGPGDEAEIRTRLEREPYLILYQRLLSTAGQSGYDLEDHERSPEQNKANIAQAAAFVYAVDRAVADVDGVMSAVPFSTEDERMVYGARAEELLVHMYTESRMQTFLTAGLDIHTAQELALYATAYDILRGADYPFADEGLIVENVASLAGEFYKDYTHDFRQQMNAYNENHMSKSASAIGLAAIVLNGYPGKPDGEDPEGYFKPENWIDFAVERTQFIVLDALVSREGSYSEGAVYFGYTAINHIPFMGALHRYTDGLGWEIDGVDWGDLLMWDENARIFDWLVRIRQPDGTFPPFDDCTPKGQYPFGLVSDLPNAALYRWSWEHQPTSYYSSGSIRQEPFLIADFDDNTPAVDPHDFGWSRNQFLYDGGNVVFRSSWDSEAVYLHAAAEHGKAAGWAMRRDGEPIDGAGGHDHNDPGAIHLVAYGEPLLLDAGYLGWENHTKVNNAYNHNLLLVDGKGPAKTVLKAPEFEKNEDGNIIFDEEGSPVIKEGAEGGWVPGPDGEAYITDWFDGPGLAYARIDTRYGDVAPATDISREILFIRDQYFAVVDTAKTEHSKTYDISLQWHGNGGGTSGGTFEELPDGGRWQYGDAAIDVRAMRPGGNIRWTTDEQIHDAGSWDERTHSRRLGTVSAGSVSFISMLLPYRVENAPPELTLEEPSYWKLLIDDDNDMPIETAIAASASPEPLTALDVKADATLLYTEIDGISRKLVVAGSDHVRFEDGRTWVDLTEPVRLYLNQPEEGYIEGSIGPFERNYVAVQVYWPAEIGFETRGVCATGLVIERDDQYVLLAIMRPGSFSVRYNENGNVFHPVAVGRMESDTGPVGEQVLIAGNLSCPEEDVEVSFEWVERPRFSEARLNVGQRTGVFTPDLPGHYLVKVTATSDIGSDSQIIRYFATPEEPIDGDVDGDEDSDEEEEIDGDGDDGTTDGDNDGPVTDGDTADGDFSDGDIEDGDIGDGDMTDGDTGDGSGSGCTATPTMPLSLLLLLMVALVRYRRRV